MVSHNIKILIKSSFFILICFVFFLHEVKALDYYSYSLDNGLNVYLIKTNNPIVTQAISYSVGSVDEFSSKQGISHLLEHLMFHGTNKYSKKRFQSILSSIGGTYSAFTLDDMTFYYTTFPSSYLKEMMDIESDRMSWLQITASEVELEKKIINEEREQSIENNPYFITMQSFRQAAFPTTNYSNLIVGWKNSIANISLEDIKDFYIKWYAPNNANLFIIGNIDFKEAQKYIKKYYGRIKYKPLPSREEYNEKNYQYNAYLVFKDNKLTEDSVVVSYLVPSFSSDSTPNKIQSYSLLLLEKILSSKSGKLYKTLIDDKKLASKLTVNYNFTSKGNSLFYITAIANTNVSSDYLLNSLKGELSIIVKEGFTSEEVSLAAQRIRDDRDFLQENERNYLIYISRYINAGMSMDQFVSLFEILINISPTNVSNYSQQMVASNSINASIYK